MKKQNMNNLLVNAGKKLVLVALLLISLNAHGNTGHDVITGKPKAKVEKTEQKEITPKDQLKTAGQILLTFGLLIGSGVLFAYAEGKENKRKIDAIKKYNERQVQQQIR